MKQGLKQLAVLKIMLYVTAVLLIVVLFIGGAKWWKNKGGIHIEAGINPNIELTPQQIKSIEDIGQWEFLAIQQEVVTDTLRKGFFTDDRLVAIYRGTLRLGVDLRLADKNWVYAHGDTVTLRLPKIRLLDRRFIDETRTKVFYESGKWSNHARQQQYYKAYNQMIRQSLTKANLKQAEDYAYDYFESMFKLLGFETIEISFSE